MPVSREVRIVIVDDERLARERLRMLLATEQDVTIVAECGDGDEALDAIRTLRPDAIFLDVRMRRLGGMEVASRITPDHPIVIVFVTAHDEFAIAAFAANAADYLLKPVNQADVSRAVARIRARLASFTAQDLQDLRRIVDN